MANPTREVLCRCPRCQPGEWDEEDRIEFVMRDARPLRIQQDGRVIMGRKIIALYGDADPSKDRPC
jgi:hypothetical protein